MISSTKKNDDKLARKAAGRWRHRNKTNKIMAWRVAGTRLTSANQKLTLQIHPTDHTTAWMIGKWARFGDKYLIMRQVSCRKYRLLEYFFYVLLHLHCHCSQYVLCIDKHWQSLVSYSGEFRPFRFSLPNITQTSPFLFLPINTFPCSKITKERNHVHHHEMYVQHFW